MARILSANDGTVVSIEPTRCAAICAVSREVEKMSKHCLNISKCELIKIIGAENCSEMYGQFIGIYNYRQKVTTKSEWHYE